MDIDLNNQVVVVTGGCGLLGQSIVESLSHNNAKVVVADINEDAINDLIARLQQKGFSALGVLMDVTSRDSIEQSIDKIRASFGRIDALVNTAYPRGANYGKPCHEVTYEDFCSSINMHIGGYFLTSQVFGEYFRKHGGGHVINFGSIYGVIPPRFEIYEGTNMVNTIEYAVIKAGIIHMSRYFAKYYKDTNVRFNTISPGGILNNQPEPFLDKYNQRCLNKGMLDKTDINGTVLFLLSKLSTYINGQNIIVDDGFVL